MISEITRHNLDAVRNPVFRAHAGRYLAIAEQFIEQISALGLELDERDWAAPARRRIAHLAERGAAVRNDAKSVLLNAISPACEACQTGVGSATYYVSLKCHRQCFYCFNPNQAGYDQHLVNLRNPAAELEAVARRGQRVNFLALTGGEPLLFPDDTLAFFETAGQRFPNAHTRLYTSGDQVNAALLEKLQAAGLDEIRFSIRMHDTPQARQHTYSRIALAKAYLPYVMVEMPVLPGTFTEMQAVLRELERLEVFSVNLLEFCFPFGNAPEFAGRGYKIKAPPYRVLYDYWYAGGLPIAGSEEVCLDLLEFALDEGLKLGVHYCSLENKHTGQIYQQNAVRERPKIAYFSEKDYFLKIAKVYGADIEPVRKLLIRKGCSDYNVQPDQGFLEFPVQKIHSLRSLDLQVGLSYNVIETRGRDKVVRELRLDLTTPQTFEMEEDV